MISSGMIGFNAVQASARRVADSYRRRTRPAAPRGSSNKGKTATMSSNNITIFASLTQPDFGYFRRLLFDVVVVIIVLDASCRNLNNLTTRTNRLRRAPFVARDIRADR